MSGTTTDMIGGVYRKVYAGFLVGRRINSVSLKAEAWFWRLHAIADDFGNLHAETTLLKALAAPRRDLSLSEISKMTRELLSARLVWEYEAGGEHYLHIDGFEARQAPRNGKRMQRFPMHPDESKAIQKVPDASSAIRLDQTRLIPDQIRPSSAADAAVPPKVKRPARPRSEPQQARDELWESVKAVWGLKDVTPAQKSRLGKLVTEFASQGAKPDEIAIRRRRIAETWGVGKDTPESTAKHWGEFAAEPDRPADGRYRGGSVTTFDRPADFDMAAQGPGPNANEPPW